MKLAMNAVLPHEYPSIRRTAEAFGISYATLARQLKGITKAKSEGNEHQQLLTRVEEKAVMHACQFVASLRFSIHYRIL